MIQATLIGNKDAITTYNKKKRYSYIFKNLFIILRYYGFSFRWSCIFPNLIVFLAASFRFSRRSSTFTQRNSATAASSRGRSWLCLL